MRAIAVNPDLIVVVSAVWQTTCTLVRSGEEGFMIDSPVLPEELEALPALAEQAGFPVSGLLASHADWDHLLGRLAFPEATLGVAESSASRLEREPGAPQRSLSKFDREWYIERPRPLQLGALQSLPVPGRLSLGEEREIELYPAPGHTPDGCAFWLPWCEVLICGDYLSPVEEPMVGGSPQEYLETLTRFEPLVRRASTVVPGHGPALAAGQALRVLEAHRAHVEALG